jgi:putative membrane protein
MNIPPRPTPSWGVRLIARTLAAFGTAYILPSVDLDQFTTAIWLAVLLALLNSTLRPLLILLTIPLTVFSFGLFLLVINAGLVMLASDWVEGFGVGGFWSAMAFSLLYSTISSLLEGQWMLRVMRARRRPF